MITLKSLGWNNFFEDQKKEFNGSNFVCGRISVEHKERYVCLTEKGEMNAEVTGKLLFNSDSASDFPKTGDWVAGILFEDENKIIIHHLLKRKTKFSRKVSGKKTDEQIIAANIDYLFIVQSLNEDFSLRRLERYASMAYEGKIDPVIILSKTDLCKDSDKKAIEVKSRFESIPVIAVSVVDRCGMEELSNIISEGKTYAFVGSSGVGKSTLINFLLGEEKIKTREIRESDSKGRHTTTRRELFALPGKGILIDTPGMRELQMWNSSEGISETFNEIDLAARNCKYSDCTHTVEAGCAVLLEVENKNISHDRYESYLKLIKEIKYLEQKQDGLFAIEHRKKWKSISKEIKKIYKNSEKY